MKTLPIAFATVLAAAAASVATASSPVTTAHKERVVRFADLDLSKPADMERLHRRVWIAARDLCASAGVMSIYDGVGIQRCTREATDRAMAEIAEAS